MSRGESSSHAILATILATFDRREVGDLRDDLKKARRLAGTSEAATTCMINVLEAKLLVRTGEFALALVKLSAIGEDSDTGTAWMVHAETGFIHLLYGRTSAAKAAFHDARETCLMTGRKRDASVQLVNIGMAYLADSAPAHARDLVDQAFTEAKLTSDSLGISASLKGKTHIRLYEQDWQGAEMCGCASLEIDRASGSWEGVLLNLGALIVAALGRGETGIVKARYDEGIGIADRLGDLRSQAHLRAVLARALYLERRFEEAYEASSFACGLLRLMDLQAPLGEVECLRAAGLAETGDLDGALAATRAGIEALEVSGQIRGVAAGLVQLGELQVRRGEAIPGELTWRRARSLFEQLGDRRAEELTRRMKYLE